MRAAKHPRRVWEALAARAGWAEPYMWGRAARHAVYVGVWLQTGRILAVGVKGNDEALARSR